MMIQHFIRERGEVFTTGAGCDVRAVIQNTAEYAEHIAVENGVRKVEGDACDGGCGVIADSRKGTNLFVSSWEDAVVHGPRGLLQVAGTVVVAETGPMREQIGFGSGRQGAHVRETTEEP